MTAPKSSPTSLQEEALCRSRRRTWQLNPRRVLDSVIEVLSQIVVESNSRNLVPDLCSLWEDAFVVEELANRSGSGQEADEVFLACSSAMGEYLE